MTYSSSSPNPHINHTKHYTQPCLCGFGRCGRGRGGSVSQGMERKDEERVAGVMANVYASVEDRMMMKKREREDKNVWVVLEHQVKRGSVVRSEERLKLASRVTSSSIVRKDVKNVGQYGMNEKLGETTKRKKKQKRLKERHQSEHDTSSNPSTHQHKSRCNGQRTKKMKNDSRQRTNDSKMFPKPRCKGPNKRRLNSLPTINANGRIVILEVDADGPRESEVERSVG
ncbi:hypothetical protein BJ165DRAFT_1598042 [Panaeolus papilionaceus]|nr:hypothetical protein BJ165DRAFT_1598042 [Panaeolus papilionaceus]